jgi:predicted DCC family thiol-disulfide oxidoreductase YuxK
MPTKEAQVRVLYDRDCGFCRWSVAQLLRLDRDGALEPVAIQSQTGGELLKSVPTELRLSSAHAVTESGEVFSGGDAATVIAPHLTGGRFLRPLAAAFPPLTRAGYDMVAGHRQSVGRLVSKRSRDAADSLLAERTRSRS